MSGKIKAKGEMPPDFADPRSPLKGRSPVPWSKQTKQHVEEKEKMNSNIKKSIIFQDE